MIINRRTLLRAALALPALAVAKSRPGRGSLRANPGPVMLDYRSDGSISIRQDERNFAVPLDLGQVKPLSEKYLDLVRQLRAPADRRELDQLSRRLYDLLWQPVQSKVQLQGSNVFLKASGFLFQFPFESLRGPDCFVGERFKIRHLVGPRPPKTARDSSLLTGKGWLYAPAGGRGLEVTRLGSAVLEAQQIRALLPRMNWIIRIGKEASKAAYYRDLSEPFSVLHIATHGVSESGSDSIGLVFRRSSTPESDAVDGIEILGAEEIQRSRLKGRLVVLAACESAAAAASDGIAGAFLTAGVTEVVAARWKIDDLATKEFMTAFYRALATGRSTASALRMARALMVQSQFLLFHDPYFWAPFLALTSTVFI